MLVPAEKLDEAAEIAAQVAQMTLTGRPDDENTVIGPVVSKMQWEKIQDLIKVGIDEGAKLIAGGLGKPDPSNAGYFVKPTVFSDVNNTMRIAREEIFGPVLSIIPYNSEEDAIAIANDTPYGLAGFVSSTNIEHARDVASKMRTGMVHINGAPLDSMAPFGGYKQSGNGREWGEYGMDEFLEIKSMYGFEPS
jgi:aldehyde dehydrogenase (NAD+)